jgi:hypothetical protein
MKIGATYPNPKTESSTNSHSLLESLGTKRHECRPSNNHRAKPPAMLQLPETWAH